MNQEHETEADADAPEQTPLMDALTYPVRGSGRILLVIGAVLSAVLGLASGAIIIGGFAWLLGLAYFNAYYCSIVESTVSWNDEPPDWPDVSDLAGEIIMPMARMLFTGLIALIPVMILVALRPDDGSSVLAYPGVWLGVLWAAFYFPMAILRVIVSNELVNALPQHVLPAIRRAMPSYLVLTGQLLAAVVISGLVTALTGRLPLIGGLVAGGISLYFTMAQARLAGVYYRNYLAESSEDGDAEAGGE
jgi:hypothetical protein